MAERVLLFACRQRAPKYVLLPAAGQRGDNPRAKAGLGEEAGVRQAVESRQPYPTPRVLAAAVFEQRQH